MDSLITTLAEGIVSGGPGYALAAFLLWRDWQKDKVMADIISKNTEAMVEQTTLIRERLHRRGDR